MTITTVEFQRDFDKYIDLSARENIELTQDGRIVALIVKPRRSAVDSLRGILKGTPDIDIREERLSKYENYD